MWKPVFIGLIVVGCLLGVVLFTSATSTFRLRTIRWSDETVVVVEKSGARVVKATAAGSVDLGAGKPKAIIEEKSFDFGRMDPETKAKHGFIVRNDGDGPLQLSVASTSCKCTIGDVGKSVLAPGESTSVVLEWNTGRTMVKYEQTATVSTNDPSLKSFDLRVKGLVRQDINFNDEELDFQDLEPGKPVTVRTMLYSQIWNQFEVSDLTTNLAGISWEVKPAVIDEANASDMTSAQWLFVTIPGDRKQGGFQDRLNLTVRPIDPGGEAVKLEIPIKGKVLRRLAYYGPIEPTEDGVTGTIDLGYVPEGKAKTVKLLVKVRDAEPELKIGTIVVEPTFVKVRLEKHEAEGSAKGLYDLYVELPADAPTCQYRGNPEGSIHIPLEHPRIKDQDLKLIFSVVPNP